MDPRLQAWLDGEIDADELPEELRSGAAAWEGLLEDVRELAAPGAAPGATGRVMATLRTSETRPFADSRAHVAGGDGPADVAGRGRPRRAARWLLRPRPIRLPPLAAAAVFVLAAWAGLQLGGAALGIVPGGVPGAPGERSVAGAEAAGPGVYVQFVLAAPNARSVALAGDFNEWTPTVELEDPDGDGVWTGRAVLEAGVHEYMFVIDGTEWRPDPHALSYADDGFGRRNSVLAVAPVDET